MVIFFSFLTLLSFSCSEWEKKEEIDDPGCVDGHDMYGDRWFVTKYDDSPFFFLFFFFDFLKITQKKIDFFIQTNVK